MIIISDKAGREIFDIIGEYKTGIDDGFYTIEPNNQLNEKETLDIFRYVYNNFESMIPIRIKNTFGGLSYFDYIKSQTN